MDGDSPAPTTEQTVTEPPKRGLSLLAKEIYGDNFHGEPEPAPEVQEQPEGEEHAALEAEENAGEQEVQASKEDGAEEVPISSVQELIEQGEYDPEWFNSLKYSVKVDGQTSEVPLSELAKSYQIVTAAEKRLEDAKVKAKAIQDEAAEKVGQINAQFAVAAKLVGKLETALVADIKSVDWEGLRESDPAEFSAKKLEFTERREAIEQMKAEAYGEFQKSTQAQQEKLQNDHRQYLQAEQALLLEKLPEWRDSEKAKAEKAKVADYLIGQGFTQEDVMGASDHRLILVARKAMLFDEIQSNTDAARKKLAKVPKVLKPGSPKPESQRSQERLDKIVANHKKAGTVDSAFALLRAKRGGATQ